MEWNKSASKKGVTAKRYQASDDLKAATVSFAIVDEASRFLTQQHLFYVYKPLQYVAGQATTLHTYVNERRSPIYAALCNCSAITTGKTARLIMVWRFRGCNSLKDKLQGSRLDMSLMQALHDPKLRKQSKQL